MAGLLGQGVSPVQLVGDALRSVERMRADLLVLYLQPESEEEEEDRVVKMEEEEGAGAVELAPSVRRALGRLPTSTRAAVARVLGGVVFGDTADPVCVVCVWIYGWRNGDGDGDGLTVTPGERLPVVCKCVGGCRWLTADERGRLSSID